MSLDGLAVSCFLFSPRISRLRCVLHCIGPCASCQLSALCHCQLWLWLLSVFAITVRCCGCCQLLWPLSAVAVVVSCLAAIGCFGRFCSCGQYRLLLLLSTVVGSARCCVQYQLLWPPSTAVAVVVATIICGRCQNIAANSKSGLCQLFNRYKLLQPMSAVVTAVSRCDRCQLLRPLSAVSATVSYCGQYQLWPLSTVVAAIRCFGFCHLL